MPLNSYFGGGGYAPEDEYNGYTGGYSPDAIMNALNQQRSPATGDPFSALLDHATNFSSLVQPPKAPPKVAPPADPFGAFLDQVHPVTPFGTAGHSPFAGGNTPPPQQAENPSDIYDQSGVRTGGTSAPPPKPTNTQDPAVAAQWYGYWIPGITAQDVSNYRISGYYDPTVPANEQVQSWWRAGKPGQKPYLGNPPPTTTTPPATGGEGGPWGLGGGNPMPYDSGNFPLPAGLTPAPTYPAPPNTGNTGGRDINSQAYLDALNRALDAQYSETTRQAMRAYRADASSRDEENTGAFGANAAQLGGELASRFGTQKAQAMLAAQEAERGRQFTGQQNSVDRALQRWGIQVNADTSRANAQTAAGSQLIASQLQYQLGLKGIQVDKDRLAEQIRNDTLDFNLGLGQQDLQKLIAGQGNQIDLFRLLLQYGPEGLFGQLFGAQQPGGYVPYTP